ncbi:MAG: hypothetical protein AAGF99_11935 [Bacteroidota bacterium]
MSEPSWVERFERAGPVGRAKLLGGGAVRLLALGIERVLDRTAETIALAEENVRKELDPNISDATILDEQDESERRGNDETKGG